MNKETIIYELEKEKPMYGTGHLRKELMKKYKISEEVAGILSIRIYNYQIETYGTWLDKRLAKSSSQDRKRVNRNAIQRKYDTKSRRDK